MGGNNNYGSTVTSNGPQLGDGLDLSHEKVRAESGTACTESSRTYRESFFFPSF
jgi:hypothetical protein